MSSKLKTVLIVAAALLLSLAGSFIVGFFSGKKAAMNGIKQSSDTVIVYKTKLVDKPVLIETRQTDFFFASFPEEKIVYKTDSVQVEIPIEQKVYEDTTYRAVVSGFRPSLDSLLLKIPTTYITNTVTKEVPKFRKWDFGIQAGAGFLFPVSSLSSTPQYDAPTPAGKFSQELGNRLGIYVGYGVTYHF